ncbi:carboxypeptidase-like regulatory domain-containing protein [Natronosalvus caseinilyticus]|uniref:carboxypeptidase-like regulatory domain-containing protein n=1 Tax=Natronosalvus caseinilyticus TaxID=2953747 RepID=UPI0028B0B5EA|nr:carboxypeptidase-like regulatory domain-containing protein [Natronosalvus caseinilyticus]
MGNYDQQTNETRSIHTGVQLLLVFIGVAFLVAGLVLAAGGSSLIGSDGPVGGLAPWDSGSSGDDDEFQQPAEDGDSDGGDDSSGDGDSDGGEQTEDGSDGDGTNTDGDSGDGDGGDGGDGSDGDSGDGSDGDGSDDDGGDGSDEDSSDGSDDDGGDGDGSDGSDGSDDDGSDGDSGDGDGDSGDDNDSDGGDNNDTDDGSDGGDGDTSTLSLIVEDEDGNPIEGATVNVEDDGMIFGYSEEKSTDGNGFAEFELEDGEYEVTVTADGYEGAQTTIEMSGDDEMLIATLQESGDSDGDNETTDDNETDS